jgi:perosamine synthetase
MDFFHTHISERSIELATEVLKSGWISEGRVVKDFEFALASQLSLCNPITVNSGTAALHLALSLCDLRSGDEVILPAQTFVATGLAILMQGATPVFADIDPLTGNISTTSISEKMTVRTKAIMPVHWGGYPCDLDEISEIAKRYNVAVIEDAAHALGATYKNRAIGSISRFTAFSFQAIKHLTTGDGGTLCCTNKEDAEFALVRRWFGIDRVNSTASILGERIYDVEEVGFKYHMNDLAAAIGLGNLGDFSATLSRRQQIGAYYRQQLKGIAGVQLLRCDDNRTHAYWLFNLLVERREDFIRRLSDYNIPSSVVHLGIDRNSVFGGFRHDLMNQRSFDESQVAIPMHSELTDQDVQYVVQTINAGW